MLCLLLRVVAVLPMLKFALMYHHAYRLAGLLLFSARSAHDALDITLAFAAFYANIPARKQ